jgi:hypothetical protein
MKPFLVQKEKIKEKRAHYYAPSSSTYSVVRDR